MHYHTDLLYCIELLHINLIVPTRIAILVPWLAFIFYQTVFWPHKWQVCNSRSFSLYFGHVLFALVQHMFSFTVNLNRIGTVQKLFLHGGGGEGEGVVISRFIPDN